MRSTFHGEPSPYRLDAAGGEIVTGRGPPGPVLAWGVPSQPDQILPVPMVDFSRQYGAIRDQVLTAIERVCDGQRFILGEEVGKFEAAAASMLGAAHGVGCGSGTDALWLAMAAAGIGPGDTVLTTPFSFFATASSILRAGARPCFADIDARTFNLDPARCAEVLEGEPVRAILPVHLYGQCADWDGFEELGRSFDFDLIEDAAQAFGARWRERPAGSLGRLAAFSFYPTKNLSAFGEAGLVATRDEECAGRVRRLRSHGMRERYLHEELGWNSRLDTLQAAVLLVKLQYVERWNRERRERAAEYDGLFRGAGLVESGMYPEHGVVLPCTDPRVTHVFHQYAIRVRGRDRLREFLVQRGIGSEVYYPVPLHLQEALAGLGYAAGDFPESERAAAEVLALPLFPELRAEEQERVVAKIAEFLG